MSGDGNVARPRRVAILAGGGKLPLMIADSVIRRGGTAHIVAIEGEAEPSAVAAYPHTWVNYGQATKMMRALKGDRPAGPDNTMVIAGAVTRPDLTKIRPDLGLFRLLPEVLKFITAGGDDALLTRIIRMYEAQGLHISGVHDVAPELLIPPGPLGKQDMDAGSARDAALGVEVLAALGDLDVGQGVVVVDGRIVAIEGVEGTDRMLARAAALRQGETGKAGVFVKRPKPKQERRVDLPTIGPRTIEGAKAAKLAGISVAAGETLVLDRDETRAMADAAGLFVVAEPATTAFATAASNHIELAPLGPHQPKSADLDDAKRGIACVSRIARFATETAAAVVRGHVIAVAADEGATGLVGRLRVAQQWGLARLGRRRGTLVVARALGQPERAFELDQIVTALARTRFAGIAFWGEGKAEAPSRHAIDVVTRAGLFVLDASTAPPAAGAA